MKSINSDTISKQKKILYQISIIIRKMVYTLYRKKLYHVFIKKEKKKDFKHIYTHYATFLWNA